MNYRALKYLMALSTPLIVFLSLGAHGGWTFLAVAYAFGLVPLLEVILPASERNMSKAEEELARKDRLYDYLIYSIVPIQYGLLVFFLFRVSDPGITTLETIGLITAFGTACGAFGINVAHELGHRHKKYERAMAKSLLLTSLYMHFIIEHNRGHHLRVSTDGDPASSRRGETVYAFWFRSAIMGYISAWHLEAHLLKKKGLPVISLHNEMIRFTLIQLALLVAIALLFSPLVMLYFMAAATMGFLLLETVNYIEHYGLRRKQISEGRYEKTMPVHSWNSNHPVGRLLLFELTRHSDHHAHSGRKYQVLRHHDESPQMPFGYPAMMVLSLVPPLWFYVMHRRINRYKQQHQNLGMALG